jgi:hypothetical protein
MSDASDNGRGDNGNIEPTIRRKDLVDELVLTFDRATCKLEVGGRVLDYNAALAILGQATRYFETLLRIQAAALVKQNADEAKRVQDLLARTRGGAQ